MSEPKPIDGLDDIVEVVRADVDGPPPLRIGRYRLCFELASGGMGKVYLARADGIGGFAKLVALKTIHPHLAKEEAFVHMFLDEARIASRISHPNVCSVFDVGHADGVYHLAMEYLLGESFSRVMRAAHQSEEVRGDPRFVARVATLIAEAASGLHAAHELKDDAGNSLGVIHRDVSPPNLFLTYGGVVQVVDFGVAKAAGQLHHTTTGTMKGKLGYIAPEVLKKEPLDRRVDVWALGVVLWEFLAGRRLFRRSVEAQTLLAVLQEPIPPPSKFAPTVPPELDAVVLRALDRSTERRYSTTAELARVLRRFVAWSCEGETVGDDELSAWMEELFPAEKARRLELVEQARQLPDHGGVPKVSSQLSESPSDPGETISGVIPRVDAAAIPIQSEEVTRPLRAPEEAVHDADPRPDRRPPRWVAMAMGIALTSLAAGVALGIWAVGDPAEPEPRSAAGAAERAVGVEARTTAPPSARPAPPESVASPPTVEDAPVEAAPQEPSPPPEAASPAAPAPAPRRRARRAHAGVGWLNVVTPDGWADIYRGGRRIGRAPGRVRLRAGVHRLELRPFGQGPGRTVRATVTADHSTTLTVRLGD